MPMDEGQTGSGGSGGHVIVDSSALPDNAAQETGGHLESIDSKTPALVGGRVPVEAKLVVESIEIGTVDQGTPNTDPNAWPVKVTASALPSGAATEATLAEIGSDLDTIEANFDVALSTRNLETTQAAVKADLDEIAIDTDNLALIKAKTDNLDVALSTRTKPSDQQHVLIDNQLSSSAAVTSVSVLITVTTVLSANATRNHLEIYHNGTKDIFLKMGTGASNSSFTVRLTPNTIYSPPINYTGAVTAISSSGTQNILVTEY